MSKPRKLYVVNREDLFKIEATLRRTSICRIGSLWIEMYMTEEDVFHLWCNGIAVRPGETHKEERRNVNLLFPG